MGRIDVAMFKRSDKDVLEATVFGYWKSGSTEVKAAQLDGDQVTWIFTVDGLELVRYDWDLNAGEKKIRKIRKIESHPP